MDANTSVVYRLLPQLIQRRVPNVPSLRRSMSWNAKATAVYDPFERPQTPTRPSTSDSDASVTPPPSYRSSRVFGGCETYSGASTPDVRPSRQVSISFIGPDGGQIDRRNSGIDWKYADQGMRLLDNALQESWSTTPTQSAQTFPRQLYLHACTYLMRALPSDLSAEEAVSVGNSLPQAVKDDLAVRALSSHGELDAARGRGLCCASSQQQHQPAPSQRRSILHRAVAFVVLHFFLVANVLLPYVRLLLAQLYRLERQHHISERVFSAGVHGVDTMGKRGLELSKRIASFSDGRVGQCANELMVWWIRGVTGGIHEGVGEGLSLVGASASMGGPRRQSLGREIREIR